MSTKSALPEGQLYIPPSVIGHPKLFSAEGIQNDPTSKPRFGCQIYLKKTDEATKAKIDADIARLTKLHLKGVKPKSKDLFISDGDGEDGDAHTVGCWIISANRAEKQGRPDIRKRENGANVILDSAEASEIYGGAVCDFIISTFIPKNWGSKICACLETVRKVKNGDRIGAARVDADEAMPDLPDEDEDGGFE